MPHYLHIEYVDGTALFFKSLTGKHGFFHSPLRHPFTQLIITTIFTCPGGLIIKANDLHNLDENTLQELRRAGILYSGDKLLFACLKDQLKLEPADVATGYFSLYENKPEQCEILYLGSTHDGCQICDTLREAYKIFDPYAKPGSKYTHRIRPAMTIAGFPMPEGWKGDSADNPNFKALGKLSAPVMRKIEPSGPAYLAYARRKLKGRTFSEDDRIEALSKVKKIEDNDDGEISEPEDPMMLQRDAKDWKGQDHYAVLGLSKYRHKATDEQIKKAHRKKVLRHHPDKKAAQGQSENDQFFKCIQRAHEILSDPVKRRQFDSVDEAADVEPPTKKQLTRPKDFYKKWGAVFQSEARFSNIKPVPTIGDDTSSKEDVEAFYDFWYDFNSWRTFEYLDEDVPDDNEGRDHKRHIEKKNSNARRKHKNDDIARLRKLVDDCLGMDERIKRFRKEGAKNKNKKRDEKAAQAKLEAEAKKKADEEAEAKKKADEEVAKADREASKKVKEAAKNAVKKNRRTVKTSVKDVNYFATGEPSAKQIDNVLDDVEAITKSMDPDQLAELVSKLTVAGKDAEKVKSTFTEAAAGKGDLKVFK